jgi:hypothetical protein
MIKVENPIHFMKANKIRLACRPDGSNRVQAASAGPAAGFAGFDEMGLQSGS